MTIARRLGTVPILASIFLVGAGLGLAQEPAPQIQWTHGPSKVDLAGNVAQVDLGAEYVFAGAADTRKLMELMGNLPSNTEVGLIAPKAAEEQWVMIFEYHSVGYVKDEEKDKIDADAILEGIRRGTEEANKIKRQRGVPTLEVLGWHDSPHYDERTHNLVWALKGRNDRGDEFVNYNVRLLGREGFMSVTLVEELAKFEASKPEVEKVLGSFDYKLGKRYVEFKPGDKVAEFGLAALVAGGAGVAAAKLGLFAALGKFLAKAWKALAVGLIAVGAGLKKLLSGRSGESQQA